MKSKLKILMVYSEVTPFSKTGGLGDVAGGLPKALKGMEHDVRIITPQYQSVNERKYVLRDVIRLQNIHVSFGSQQHMIHVKSAFLPDSKVQVYFIDHKPSFFRKGLYVDPKTGKDYPDNWFRFALFSKGALETLVRLHWQPDIIHCNDWQTALIPFFLKTEYKENSFFTHLHTLLTVHNFAFQGNFNVQCADSLGIDLSSIPEPLRPVVDSQISFLKAGLLYADVINTVSEQHAKDAQSSPESGFGFEMLLSKRKRDFFGIVNGIDNRIWNPESDSFIPVQYSMHSLEGKKANKKALLERFGLPLNPEVPVIAMVSRLTEQKGIDLVCSAFDEILSLGFYFVLLGQGEEQYHRFFTEKKKAYSKKFGVSFEFNEALAHLMIAGADMYLMPSRFEPCGLTHLYSQKYGTVPIVTATGGLVDTVEPFSTSTGKGTGFFISSFTVKSLIQTLKQALKSYSDPKIWVRIQKNGMKKDFSWEIAAKKYVQLYHRCMGKR